MLNIIFGECEQDNYIFDPDNFFYNVYADEVDEVVDKQLL